MKSFLLNRCLPIALVLSVIGCGAMRAISPDPYLPPPPRSLSAMASIIKPDTLAAIVAESLLVNQIAKNTIERDSIARADRIFPSRFEDGLTDPGGESAVSTREATLLREREAYRNAALGWSGVRDTEFTMLLSQAWGHLRAALRTGDAVTTRASVWPAGVFVGVGTARIIRLESGWIDLGKISPRELRCGQGQEFAASTPVVAGGKPAVRMVAFIEAAEYRNKSAVTAASEFRGVSSCVASSVWRDRVADFAFDAWMGAERAVKLGGPPLIIR